jgi:hypothetical protein
MVTFAPKGGANGAAFAVDPPVLALEKSATRASARDRIVIDRTRNMETSPTRGLPVTTPTASLEHGARS